MSETEINPFKVSTVPCPKCGLELDAGVPICPNDGSTVLATPDIGELFDNKYEFLERRAAGGMGVVYKANQRALNRIVAIKVLQIQNVTEKAVRRFQQEATALAKLENPNLVQVFELGVTDYGQLYSVMEFVDGKGLDELLTERGIPSLAKALNIFIQVCDALDYVHNYGIYHRDLKPSNIMLINPYDEQPKVKLVDFGIAKVLDQTQEHSLTQTGDLFGSPLYMSPEQAKGGLIDRRSDLYSLGCVMYEVLTAQPPFNGQSIIEVLMKHAGEKHTPLSIAAANQKYPNALETLVNRLLAKDPSDRYQSAQEVRAELKALATQQKSWYHISLPRIDDHQTNRTGWFAIVFGVLSVFTIACSLIYAFFADNPLSHPKPVVQVLQDPNLPTAYGEVEGDELLRYPQEDRKAAYEMLHQKDKLDLRYSSAANSHYLRDRKDFQVSELRWHRADDAAIASLPDFPLHVLDIGKHATGASIKRIVQLPSLVELDMKDIALTKEDCRELLKLKRLHQLDLTRCHLDDDCLKEIARLQHLDTLVLSKNLKITDKGIQYLAAEHMPAYSLDLTATGISDKSAASLATLSELERLSLSDTAVTNNVLNQLASLKRLRYLDLQKTNVNQAGIINFKPVKLYRLIVTPGTLSYKGVAQFKKNNPQCLVYPDDEKP